MFAPSVLFAVLSILAHLNTAAAAADERALNVLEGISGDQGGNYHPTSGNQYGFGWFHPGAFNEGDRCWQHDREGTIGNALCLVADIKLGGSNDDPFNGWFDEPYYGYGHRFGWYHPGPYLDGDRCYENGRDGVVQDTVCVSVNPGPGTNGGLLNGLNLNRRNLWGPDTWREPHFSSGHNFGWFHDGDFVEGDRCWSDGYYGSIIDSLCIVTDLDLNTKRDDLTAGLTNILNGGGRSSYARGDRCYKQGVWGRWRANDCNIVDAAVNVGDANYHASERFQDGDKCWRAGSWGVWSGSDCSLLDILVELGEVKRNLASPFLFRDDPRFGRGVPCTKDGQEGVLRDSICIIAEVDVSKRRHEDDVSYGVTKSWEDASHDSYYDEDDDAPEAEEGSEEAAYDEAMEKRFLRYESGSNRNHDKTLSKLLKDIRTRRSLLDGGSSGIPIIGQIQNGPGGFGESRSSAGKSAGGPLGGLGSLGGIAGVMGKRTPDLDGSRSRLEELMSSIGLARRSAPISEIAPRGQLDGIFGKLHRDQGAALLGGGSFHQRGHSADLGALTDVLSKARSGASQH